MTFVQRSIIAFALSISIDVSTATAETKLSPFVQNNVRHVLMHELAHALLREFELPVIGNEESIAESFAVISMHDIYPNQVQQIIKDRATALRFEAAVDGLSWELLAGEHPHDFQRAYWAYCLLEGLEPDATKVPVWVHMTKDDAQNCQSIADDISSGWSTMLLKTLGSHEHGEDQVELIFGEGPLKDTMEASGLLQEFTELMRYFNWPERVTLHFDHCDQGASWSKSEKRILLCDNYVQRFIDYEDKATAQFP
jgi:hypothetical protein